MKKSKIIALAIVGMLSIFGLSLVPTSTYAATSVCEQSNVPEDILKANGCPGHGNPADLSNIIIGIVNGVIGILGLVAAIFIIVGGVNYMTSVGDANKVAKAKNTILYAVIGLIIAVLSFAIVNFVIVNLIKGEGDSTTTSESDSDSDNESGGGGNTGDDVIEGGGGN